MAFSFAASIRALIAPAAIFLSLANQGRSPPTNRPMTAVTPALIVHEIGRCAIELVGWVLERSTVGSDRRRKLFDCQQERLNVCPRGDRHSVRRLNLERIRPTNDFDERRELRS